jgi:hypothetical protein
MSRVSVQWLQPAGNAVAAIAAKRRESARVQTSFSVVLDEFHNPDAHLEIRPSVRQFRVDFFTSTGPKRRADLLQGGTNSETPGAAIE